AVPLRTAEPISCGIDPGGPPGLRRCPLACRAFHAWRWASSHAVQAQLRASLLDLADLSAAASFLVPPVPVHWRGLTARLLRRPLQIGGQTAPRGRKSR